MAIDDKYQKYVYDIKNRKQIFKFNEMYKAELVEGFDSWHMENTKGIGKEIALMILNRYNWNNILDIGCAKGVFTHLLKKENNHIVGIDISEEAIKEARRKYPMCQFEVCNFPIEYASTDFLKNKFDLTVIMESLSFMEDWQGAIKLISMFSDYIYLALYLPKNPIGNVKSFRELRSEFIKYFDIIYDFVQVSDGSKRVCMFGMVR